MDTISRIREKAKSRTTTIALPEYQDKRTVEAHRIIEKEGIAKSILLTPDTIDRELQEKFIAEYYEMRKAKGMDLETARKIFNDPLYYAVMLLRHGQVDGMVAGASHTSADMARACLQCLSIDRKFGIACSCFIMVVPNCPYGENGTFIYADAGLIPEPDARQLSAIAMASADMAAKVLGVKARVAFLSYSTKGSAKAASTERIAQAVETVKKNAPELIVDGEMQVDAAIVPEVAKTKCPDSPLEGHANILIFPSLEAGNIGYKLTERLSGARALGPLLLGFTKPASDLSRGCSVQDIVDCAAVTAIRAGADS
jgi:phosphate acetyltransferase